MTQKDKNRFEQTRPDAPDTPHLCAGCRHGLVMLHKFQTCDEESTCWKTDKFRWQWTARCNNPRIAGAEPEFFWAPIVDCEGYEARKSPSGKKNRKKHKKKKSKSK